MSSIIVLAVKWYRIRHKLQVVHKLISLLISFANNFIRLEKTGTFLQLNAEQFRFLRNQFHIYLEHERLVILFNTWLHKNMSVSTYRTSTPATALYGLMWLEYAHRWLVILSTTDRSIEGTDKTEPIGADVTRVTALAAHTLHATRRVKVRAALPFACRVRAGRGCTLRRTRIETDGRQEVLANDRNRDSSEVWKLIIRYSYFSCCIDM